MIRPVLAFTVLFLTASTARTATLHVPADYPTIQAAVDQTAEGDTVLVAPGTYTDCTHLDGTGTLNCVIIPRRIVLRSSAGRDVTTIDAGGQGRGVRGDAEAKIEGFTIRGGSAFAGAGVAVGTSTLVLDFTVSACRFIDNHSEVYGGGLLMLNHSEQASIVEESEFFLNSAGENGAAIYFTYWLRVADCVVVGNGPSFSTIHGTPVGMELERTLVAGNQGRGLSLQSGWGSDVSVFASDCTITDNAEHAIDSNMALVLTRCIVGGTIHCTDYSYSTFDFVDQFEGALGGICSVTWNQPNLDADPLFCDPENGDYRLQSDSPCLPQNNPYGVLYGALGEGCGTVSVEPESWTRIKARYRD